MKNEADLDDVKDYIQSLLTPPSNVVHGHIDKSPLGIIFRKVASFNELHQLLQDNFCSWYNDALISALRRKFLYPEIDEGIIEYKNLLKQYVRRRCFLFLNDVGPQPQEMEMVPVTCIIDVDFELMSQAEIEKLKLKVIECLTIHDCILILKSIKEVFEAPTWTGNMSTLAESQVCSLNIDERKLLTKVMFIIFICTLLLSLSIYLVSFF